MKYNRPEMEILQLEVVDIITSSPITDGGDATPSVGGEPVITTPPNWGQ